MCGEAFRGSDVITGGSDSVSPVMVSCTLVVGIAGSVSWSNLLQQTATERCTAELWPCKSPRGELPPGVEQLDAAGAQVVALQ